MASIKVPMTIEMDDGRILKAVVDQRDYAAVEAQEIDSINQRNIWARFIAFNALTRTKQYGGTWEQFNTVDCLEAISHSQEESTDAESLDPGRPAPTGGA
jgi:hypothetical protein